MVGTAAISATASLSSSAHPSNSNSIPKICFWKGISHSGIPLSHTCYFSFLSTSQPPRYSSFYKGSRRQTQFSVRAASSSASVGSAEYVEEPTTKTKFQQSLSLPGCSGSLSLFGTGYREKVFAIIGVKVYAAGLYLNLSLTSELNAWKGKSADAIQEDSSVFKKILQSPSEKSLQIVLVRDVDGKTFWDALDDSISPRIKAPTAVDKTALSMFRSVFQDRPLKKGTVIFLTWLDASKLLVSVTSKGPPSAVDATIESASVTSALFDVFLGDTPVSPSLKASVAEGLSQVFK